ncbi:sorbin and SH3 domain-containing protein 1 homolog isoform X2 [Acropora muricata]|uniref:sorbin and SH3 domain-containing protein 1 homolog isoform X2 n=1 Tax=Acropora muricata TaxID=159855 RepID=UPI0034E5EDA7
MPGNPSPLLFKYDMASGEEYEVVLSGGAPWGFRLQGGKEFRAPLRIAKVTSNSKAEKAGITEGLLVRSINSANCEDWTHSDALNSIKRTGSVLKLVLSRRPASSPDPVLNSGGFFTSSSSYTTDNIEDGNITRISSASFKPSSSSNNSLSYVTMPRGNDAKKWRDVEENNNVDVFPSRTGDLTNSHEWNPDIISGVVRPPEQIKLVQDLEAIRAVSSLSSSSEPSVHVRAPSDSRGFVDKPRPIGRGGRRLTTGSIGSEEEFNMANGDASSSDSAPSVTRRPALQQFKRQKEQAAVEATKEPKPIRPAAPPTQPQTQRYSDEYKTNENPVGPHRPSIQRGGKWYKEMFKELHSSAGTSSNLSGLLASDVAKGAIRDHESTGSLTPPRSSSPSLDHRDNEVFSTKVEYEPVRNTNNVSYEPRPSWSSSDSERSGGEKRPSRMSSSHVPAWYKDMQKGVEVPVQKIEEPESYLVQRRPAYGSISEERRFQEPHISVAPLSMSSSPPATYVDPRRSPSSVTVQMEEKYLPPSASSLYESRFRGRQGSARTASEELQLQQQPPSDEDIYRRREEEAAAARRRREEEEEEWRRREEEERRRIAEEEIQRRRELEEERLRREYEAEVARRWREEEEERARREANKPQFIARALYSFNGQTEKELSFRKGDIINVRRQVDKNWIDGELNGRRGIFPTNYVEVRPVDEEDEPPPAPSVTQKTVPRVQVIVEQAPPALPSSQTQQTPQTTVAYSQPPQASQAQQVSSRPVVQQAAETVNIEGEARVRYNFKAETRRELPCNKGDIIALLRKVDSNWYEGRVGDRRGIVPSNYLEVFIEPEVQVVRQEPVQASKSVRVEQEPGHMRAGYNFDQRQHQQQLKGPPRAVTSGQVTVAKPTQVKYIEEPVESHFGGGVVAHAVLDEPRIGSEPGERYRAMFSYEPVNEDELRLEEGEEVIVLEKCDDGWFVGTSARTNMFGTFPGNYVERMM